MQFLVSHVSIEPNVRGQEMRRVRLIPLPGEVFGGDDAPPDAQINLLLTTDAAKRFQIGDTFDVSFRERDK